MRATRVSNGTEGEWRQLCAAVENNCTCADRPYFVDADCSAHQLLETQRSLDRLLFARRIATRLLQEELSASPIQAA